PHEHDAVVVHGHPLDVDEFRLQVFEVSLVKLKLPGEGTIRHAPMALQQRHHLFQHLVERHAATPPSPARWSRSCLPPTLSWYSNDMTDHINRCLAGAEFSEPQDTVNAR